MTSHLQKVSQQWEDQALAAAAPESPSDRLFTRSIITLKFLVFGGSEGRERQHNAHGGPQASELSL